jgi:hypothetical protein
VDSGYARGHINVTRWWFFIKLSRGNGESLAMSRECLTTAKNSAPLTAAANAKKSLSLNPVAPAFLKGMIMLRIYKCDQLVTVKDAPVGLIKLKYSEELICKSEETLWRHNLRQCDCTIVSTGEQYCGGDDKLGWPLIIQ